MTLYTAVYRSTAVSGAVAMRASLNLATSFVNPTDAKVLCYEDI